MELGSINIAVKDPDVALQTYLKLFGTNNVQPVMRLKGLRDDREVLDGYWLRTKPINLGLFTPRDSTGRMGEFLKKYGEGIHHITLVVTQDEFEQNYTKFKEQGMPISKPIYIGKFSEPIFWVEESGEQGVPVKFAAKAYRTLTIWEETMYLDTPQRFEKVNITEEILRPKVNLGKIMITVNNPEKHQGGWGKSLLLPRLEMPPPPPSEKPRRHVVDDYRGNVWAGVGGATFPSAAGINVYYPTTQSGPMYRVMNERQRNVIYHNMCCYPTRDRYHEFWRQLEEAGFAMVDPKPKLNENAGNGNYFSFVHPISTHGVTIEIVSYFAGSSSEGRFYDWADTELYMVSPESIVYPEVMPRYKS